MVEPAVASRGGACTDTGDCARRVTVLLGWRGAPLGELWQRKREPISQLSLVIILSVSVQYTLMPGYIVELRPMLITGSETHT